jgi:hypothetical protein
MPGPRETTPGRGPYGCSYPSPPPSSYMYNKFTSLPLRLGLSPRWCACLSQMSSFAFSFVMTSFALILLWIAIVSTSHAPDVDLIAQRYEKCCCSVLRRPARCHRRPHNILVISVPRHFFSFCIAGLCFINIYEFYNNCTAFGDVPALVVTSRRLSAHAASDTLWRVIALQRFPYLATTFTLLPLPKPPFKSLFRHFFEARRATAVTEPPSPESATVMLDGYIFQYDILIAGEIKESWVGKGNSLWCHSRSQGLRSFCLSPGSAHVSWTRRLKWT